MPLISVLMSARNDARFLREAIDSILRQTLTDLELIVVDDASTDETAEVLASADDARVVVLRNDEQLGLAASLNRALGSAGGKYAARLDADDVAEPTRLQLQVARLRDDTQLAVVGSAVVDLDEEGRRGRTHVMPRGATPLRWHALFSSPFFHPTVLVDRDALDAHGLRYDPSFTESEDYDLWTRVFEFANGDNLRAPLVLKRVHAGQASQRRADVQESFQRQVALREIARVAPGLSPEEAEAAWAVGSRIDARRRGVRPFLALLKAFERQHGADRDVRRAVAKAVVRACV